MSLNKSRKKDDLSITVYQLMILLNNYVLSLKEPSIGHLDCDINIKDTLARFKRTHLNMSPAELERFLFASNMLNEEHKFWHPGGDSFDKFVYDVARAYKFDKQYNKLVSRNEKKEG